MARLKYWDEKSQTWKYADKVISNINVDLTGYATEEYVDNAVNNVNIPEVDLSPYALKSEIPSIEGLASEAFVGEAINNYEASHDLELIASFTTTEAVKEILIDKDFNNEPFELEAVTIELLTPTDGSSGEGSSGTLAINFGTVSTQYALRSYSSAGFPYRGYQINSTYWRESGFRAYATVRNKLGVCSGYAGDMGEAKSSMATLKNYIYIDMPITRIQVSGGTALPTNATITVYGARRGNNA